MKEQILRNLIRESIKKMISESTLKEYSGDSGLEELADTLGYADVIDFFEDNQGAVEAVYKWVESIPALRQQMKQSGMNYMHDPEFQKSQASFVAGVKSADKSITTQQATKIAEKFAKYMSNKENKKFTVTKNSVEGPSFDLDLNGEEYDGGSYIIDTKGDIVNVALSKPEVYGNISMLESKLNEAKQTVKSEAASRLADFFRVPVHTLDKFNFDGNDNIQALSTALNSTSTQGTEMYYKMAIKLAKEELGVTESNLKEVDMSKRYDGFTVIDNKTKKQYKFRYIRGVDNVKDENDAIKTVMVVTKQPRSNFMVYNLIKKGDFDKTKGEVIESTNVMETKIKEAGGRRFIKSEDIRQHTMSKIKEANKKK